MSNPIYSHNLANIVLVSVLASSVAGFFSGGIAYSYLGHLTRQGSLSGNVAEVNVSEEQSAIIDLVQNTKSSVVSISVTKEVTSLQNPWSLFFGQEGRPEVRQQEVGGGTGFVVSTDGLILTNKHVVSDDDAEYTVVFDDGSRADATIKALHPTQDLALIEVKTDNLRPLSFADSTTIKVGQTAVAIGNVLSEFDNSVSRGVVSGLSRSIVASDRDGNAEQLTNIIQTDAAINPGNSGGPLLDINGNVIGINVATATSAQNLGFAIPSNVALEMIEDVVEFGEVRVPFIGVQYSMILPGSDEAREFNIERGALIRSESSRKPILDGSPADQAGLREGDIILQIEDKELSQKMTLADALLTYEPGDKIEIIIQREGKTEQKSLTLKERN